MINKVTTENLIELIIKVRKDCEGLRDEIAELGYIHQPYLTVDDFDQIDNSLCELLVLREGQHGNVDNRLPDQCIVADVEFDDREIESRSHHSVECQHDFVLGTGIVQCSKCREVQGP